MALIWESWQPRSSGVFILLSSFIASHELASQKILANDNEPKVERNATLMILPREWYGMCSGSPTNPSYDKVIANNFTLAPEVCLSGVGMLGPRLFLLETSKCLVNGTESPAVLTTHNDEKCNSSSQSSTPPIMPANSMGSYGFHATTQCQKIAGR